MVLFDGLIFANHEYGGINRYLAELVRHIAADGRMRPIVHAPYYVSKYLDDLRDNGVSVQGRRLPIFKGVSLIANNLNRFQRIKKDYEIFHSGWYPQSRPRGRGKILAFMAYDMIAELFPDEVSNAKAQTMQKRLALKIADIIFASSESAKMDLVKIAEVDAKQIVVTPLATSIAEFSPEKKKTACHPPYILYVGRRSGYKNFSSILQAFRSSRKIGSEFQLVCFGGEKFSPEELGILRHMPAEGPGSVLRVTGDDSVLAERYANAALFVCSSKYEGFGIPLLEAMTCGCPVVSTQGGSLREVGGNAPLYAEDATPDALRFAMESILFDSSATVRGIEAGLERAKHFSWKETASRTVDAYLQHIRH